MRVKLLVVAAVLMIAGVAEAGLSKAAQEWRRGPDKFLMTDEEEKGWKSVSTDAAAAAFIDLFWARRDPTMGTPRNEFREEFLTRVRYSDGSFAEKRRRGALSDRGQVYILIGPPEKGSRQTMALSGMAAQTGATRSAEALAWSWPRELAVSLGVPKIIVKFNQIVGTDTYSRDTKDGQFSNVSATAIRLYILHPEMTAVPEWAMRVSDEVFGTAATTTAVAAPRTDAKAEGRIGRLVLMRELGALDFDAATDPFASFRPAADFAVDGELAYVLEYCGNMGVLKVETKINDDASASELEPVPMKSVAGCAAVPGMLSLAGLDRGSYNLEITTIEANGGRLTTKQRFHIK
jgi:GWxTD domain-containing protein